MFDPVKQDSKECFQAFARRKSYAAYLVREALTARLLGDMHRYDDCLNRLERLRCGY